ncbi:MAG: hypothetical protein EOP83_14840 [Verrucomicrobiaceae bacterium]|nr:MAG: hypothetical protein EOP83_14840 [Verrucomicrobiaceae bacterium]
MAISADVLPPYHDALLRCAARYLDMMKQHGVPADDPLAKFVIELIDGCYRVLPDRKLNRWLGYIQGIVIERGFTTVTAERDWTRPLFRPLDFPSDEKIREIAEN